MLCPLLYLTALMALAETFTVNKAFNISTCNITYYQKSYSRLYVNFTEERFVICFNGFFNLQKNQDCITVPKPRIKLASKSMQSSQPTYEARIKKNVPTISNNMTCFIKFEIVVNGYNVALILSKFGSQTALEFYSETPHLASCEVKVHGKVVECLFAGSQNSRNYTDISGCRVSGIGIKTNTTTRFPATCTSISCNITRYVTHTSCGNQEHCDGNNTCLIINTCTVTGPTIIDIHGKFNSTGDRCAYSLLLDSWFSGYGILAKFRERRRKGVSFLDSLTLRLFNLSTDIHLKQGGKVLVNSSLQTLNSTVQEVHGVKLSKDQTGIHAKLISKHFVSVFFDGTTAQVHLEVPVGSPLGGLCGNSSSFSSAKLSDDSVNGCETLHTESADSTISCIRMTERCSLLQEEPFSSCNSAVDPAPYITACNETLCKYPDVDGLRCQFLWAYARACSLKNATLDDWWSGAQCDPPEAFCQDKNCSDHEFCGKKSGGDKVCLCRALFASSYRDSNTLGGATVCTQNSASVSLVGCLLEGINIDYTHLHLNDKTCKGEMDEESHMVTFSFDSIHTCGAMITANDTHVTYKNTIRGLGSSSDIIYRQYQFYTDFLCVIAQPELKTVAFRIKDSSVVQHITSGDWDYTVIMKAYTDADRTQAVHSNTLVMLDQKIWMRVETEGLDGNTIAVVTDSCWATPQASSSSTPRHSLVQDGCADAGDQTVKVERNGVGTFSHFSFNMFQFIDSSDGVYLHCKLNLCVSCVLKCPSGTRKQRSAAPEYKPEASAIITMAWIN